MSSPLGSLATEAGWYRAQPLRNEDGTPRMRKPLITNRGEIACCIIDTRKKLSIATVAIFVSDVLTLKIQRCSSRHVALADQAISLGPIDQRGRHPYLNAQKLVNICLDAGADAVHPGYGYLSENADFADQVRNAGITFVGPSSGAMSTLGDKRTAKAYLGEHDSQDPFDSRLHWI
ncbi:hypothetical protein LTR37_001668 [Vermiconidia calcicola]|uniref:Uncharacterized protein n=1 Tax=Vermiconidia calcicola TaxID=1690605 RepID=A0ACC3NWC0_9PEZI|nr:hypothetical protein LTR37_001668 [Vermiconidia calcicola]